MAKLTCLLVDQVHSSPCIMWEWLMLASFEKQNCDGDGSIPILTGIVTAFPVDSDELIEKRLECQFFDQSQHRTHISS